MAHGQRKDERIALVRRRGARIARNYMNICLNKRGERAVLDRPFFARSNEPCTDVETDGRAALRAFRLDSVVWVQPKRRNSWGTIL